MHWKHKSTVVVPALGSLLMLMPAPAEPESLALKLGRFSPRVESALWEENLETFTITEEDFDAFIGGVEFAFELSEYFDITVGIEGSSKTVFSTYRDLVRDDGTEITQDITLRIAPLTIGTRFVPLGKFRRLIPFVTGGGGFYFYEYREEGEFVDFSNFIFGDVFIDRGVAYGAYLGGGLEVGVTPEVFLFGEYRRHWAFGDHGRDFDEFGRFDLKANEVSFGVLFRF